MAESTEINKKPFWYPDDKLRYQIIPPAFVIFFTAIVQYLVIIARGEDFTFSKAWANTKGNSASWNWVVFIIIWAIVSLKIPSKIIHGPETSFGYKPPYKDNGRAYYVFTISAFLMAQIGYPWLSVSIYENFPQILGSFNIVALALCTFLLIKGKYFPEHPNDPIENHPILYEFYRGTELHPRLFDMDVKQLTNCRIGMMVWQIFIFAFMIAGTQLHGFNLAVFTTTILQTVYIAKFFEWEAGYFYTLDMMLDRAGFYICWGCLVWVPCLYAYTSNYFVAHRPDISPVAALFVFVLGFSAILLNYRVDCEKQFFRNSPNFKCQIWGKEAKYVLAEYTDEKGNKKNSALLVSGFWGISRHLNYFFELLAALCWCGTGGFQFSFWPYLYFIFLTGLLVHRTIRDEEKCKKKYGNYWSSYCEIVPYRILPFVW